MQTSYQIAEQIGERGYFAKVTLSCRLLKETKLIIGLDEPVKQWENAINFASEYFFLHLKNVQGLEVRIVGIDDNPVDTSPIIIVFVIIRAIEEHLKLGRPSLVEFDKANGLFVFTK